MGKKLLFIALMLVGTSYADVARKLHCGELLGCFKESRRKIAWVSGDSASNDYKYIEPKKNYKFIIAYVRVKPGFSISTMDYELVSTGNRYKCLSITRNTSSSNFGDGFKELVNNGKSSEDVKLLFEILESDYLVDFFWNLPTTIQHGSVNLVSVLELG
ncbi:MAG: hypothetical protein ACRC37_08030, partial [Lentisphaeria bacterium]